MSCDEATQSLLQVSANYVLEAEKEFVQTYESLPVLWDKSNLHYANKYKRNECLEKLLDTYKKLRPHATVNDVRKKINSLRSNYRRELKKVILSRSSGDGKEYVPKSWLYECLHFLNKFEQPLTEINESQDPLDVDTSLDTEQYEETEIEETIEIDQNVLHKYELQEPDIETKHPPSKEIYQYFIAPKGSILPSNDDTETPRKKIARKYQSSYYEPNCSYSEAPKYNTLAMYWSEKLENLSTTQRIYAEKAINDVLLEAELGNLTKNSVKINEHEEASNTRPESSS